MIIYLGKEKKISSVIFSEFFCVFHYYISFTYPIREMHGVKLHRGELPSVIFFSPMKWTMRLFTYQDSFPMLNYIVQADILFHYIPFHECLLFFGSTFYNSPHVAHSSPLFPQDWRTFHFCSIVWIFAYTLICIKTTEKLTQGGHGILWKISHLIHYLKLPPANWSGGILTNWAKRGSAKLRGLYTTSCHYVTPSSIH